MARDYREEFKHNCLTCKKYDIYSKADATVRGFRCKRLMRQMSMDEHCYQHDFDQLRSNSTIEDAVNWILRRGYDPRPDCYVTTAICEILGLPYDHEYIKNFKKLRNDHMKIEQIMAYDVYGVQIAQRLKSAYSNKETRSVTEKLVKDILHPSYLVEVNKLIKGENYDLALYSYFQMLGVLSERYGINYVSEPLEIKAEEPVEITRGGSYEGA